MLRSTSRGKCSLCGKDYGKGQMTTHLKSCLRKAAGAVSAKGGSGAEKSRAFHLAVEGYGLAEYWMHLEAPVSETLEDLDHLLRQTWLECCGHLSCFVVGRQVYSSFTGDDFFDPSDDDSMDFKLGPSSPPGAEVQMRPFSLWCLGRILLPDVEGPPYLICPGFATDTGPMWDIRMGGHAGGSLPRPSPISSRSSYPASTLSPKSLSYCFSARCSWTFLPSGASGSLRPGIPGPVPKHVTLCAVPLAETGASW